MRIVQLFVVFASLIFLFSCTEDKPQVGRYGMLDENTPEYTVVIFMKSIYEQDNIDEAVSLSTERFGRILSRYHTNRNVQRHIMNLRYDPPVEIVPQAGSKIARAAYAEKVTLTLYFSGMLGDDKIEDLRDVDLIRVDGEWKVDKVYPDHFF